jgi:hypothetical protein
VSAEHEALRAFLAAAAVPCGHPPDPVAFVKATGDAICHCGCMLDRSLAHMTAPGAPGPIVMCTKCGCNVAVPDPELVTDAPSSSDTPGVDHGFLLGLAAYAERVIVATDGMWPPHARATAARQGLREIASECRREASATTDQETACQPR